MNKELQQAYHDTAIDFAQDGNIKMYDYYMNKMVSLSGIPKELIESNKNQFKEQEVDEHEKRFTKFLNKLRNNIF